MEGYKFDRKKSCELIETKNILTDFISYSQVLEFCILSGCDFFKYPKISIGKAYRVIMKYNSFLLAPLLNLEFFVKNFIELNIFFKINSFTAR